MSRWLLDTSAVLAHYREEIGADRVQDLLEDDQVELAVASITIAELARKLVDLGADSAEAREVALEYAGMVEKVVAVDTAVAVRAFDIGGSASGRIPLVDALIAACASSVDATLVHRDPHFDSVAPGLVVGERL